MGLNRLLVLAVFLACCLASSALACEFCTPENMDPGDYGWSDGFDDATWMAGTGNNPPTMLTCLARARNDQRCRDCVDAYYDNGTPKGYKICAKVAYSQGCSCDNAGTPNCRAMGVCRYEP